MHVVGAGEKSGASICSCDACMALECTVVDLVPRSAQTRRQKSTALREPPSRCPVHSCNRSVQALALYCTLLRLEDLMSCPVAQFSISLFLSWTWTDHQPAANCDLARTRAPYFQKNMGAGTPIAMPMKASRLLPQPYSRCSYSCGAKRGKAKPAMLLMNVTAAIALAA